MGLSARRIEVLKFVLIPSQAAFLQVFQSIFLGLELRDTEVVLGVEEAVETEVVVIGFGQQSARKSANVVLWSVFGAARPNGRGLN